MLKHYCSKIYALKFKKNYFIGLTLKQKRDLTSQKNQAKESHSVLFTTIFIHL